MFDLPPVDMIQPLLAPTAIEVIQDDADKQGYIIDLKLDERLAYVFDPIHYELRALHRVEGNAVTASSYAEKPYYLPAHNIDIIKENAFFEAELALQLLEHADTEWVLDYAIRMHSLYTHIKAEAENIVLYAYDKKSNSVVLKPLSSLIEKGVYDNFNRTSLLYDRQPADDFRDFEEFFADIMTSQAMSVNQLMIQTNAISKIGSIIWELVNEKRNPACFTLAHQQHNEAIMLTLLQDVFPDTYLQSQQEWDHLRYQHNTRLRNEEFDISQNRARIERMPQIYDSERQTYVDMQHGYWKPASASGFTVSSCGLIAMGSRDAAEHQGFLLTKQQFESNAAPRTNQPYVDTTIPCFISNMEWQIDRASGITHLVKPHIDQYRVTHAKGANRWHTYGVSALTPLTLGYPVASAQSGGMNDMLFGVALISKQAPIGNKDISLQMGFLHAAELAVAGHHTFAETMPLGYCAVQDRVYDSKNTLIELFGSKLTQPDMYQSIINDMSNYYPTEVVTNLQQLYQQHVQHLAELSL